jgi:hypothetical protein
MLVGAVRLAVLVTSGDCAAIDGAMPGTLPSGYRAWAAACWIGQGDEQAAAASALQDAFDPLASAQTDLEVALLDHAAASGQFREKIRELSQPRAKAEPVEPIAKSKPASRPRRKGGRTR